MTKKLYQKRAQGKQRTERKVGDTSLTGTDRQSNKTIKEKSAGKRLLTDTDTHTKKGRR